MPKKTKADLERELSQKTALLERFNRLREEGQIGLNCCDADSLDKDIRQAIGVGCVTDNCFLVTYRVYDGVEVPACVDPDDPEEVEDSLKVTILDHNGGDVDFEFYEARNY